MELPSLVIDSKTYTLSQEISDHDFDGPWESLRFSFRKLRKEEDLFDGPLYHTVSVTDSQILVQTGISYRQFIGMRSLVNREQLEICDSEAPRVLGLFLVLTTKDHKTVLFPRTGGEWGDCYELPGYSVTPRFKNISQALHHVVYRDCPKLENYIDVGAAQLLGSIELPDYLEHNIIISLELDCDSQQIKELYPQSLVIDLMTETDSLRLHPPTHSTLHYLTEKGNSDSIVK